MRNASFFYQLAALAQSVLSFFEQCLYILLCLDNRKVNHLNIENICSYQKRLPYLLGVSYRSKAIAISAT